MVLYLALHLTWWTLLLLAATVQSFAHLPLGISDSKKMVLWSGWSGCAEFSLHTKNVRSVWFIVKRRGCCCNLSGGVALIVCFTTNRMCVKNITIIYVARANNNKSDCDTWSLLLLRCKALRTCRLGFPIPTKWCCDQDVEVVLCEAFIKRTCDWCGSL